MSRPRTRATSRGRADARVSCGRRAVRGVWLALGGATLGGLFALSTGCDDVPVLLFLYDGGVDGGVDGGTGADDAGAAANDGSDQGDVAVGDEMPDESGCPAHLPSGASVCCGSVACNGNCTAPQCSVCEMQCGPATLCCAKTNNVSCRPMGSPCP